MSTATIDDWTMEVPKPSQGDYVLCAAGNYPATVTAVIDTGTHEEKSQQGPNRKVRKLVIAFELKKQRPDGRPFILADRYTWSMSEKSNFYGVVCGIIGRKFKEGEKFDPRLLLGVPVMLNVTNSQKG